MKNSVVITLIICGTFLTIVPFIHNSIISQQVANTMTLLDKPVDIKTSLSKSYYRVSTTIGATMILAGFISSLRKRATIP
jgi:hypothetical protein